MHADASMDSEEVWHGCSAEDCSPGPGVLVGLNVLQHDPARFGRRQLGTIGGGVLRAVDLTPLHLRKPLKRKRPSCCLPSARRAAPDRRYWRSTARRPG